MRDKWWFPVGYMFVMTAFFSSIVIGFSQFTSDRVEANEYFAFEKAVLAVLPGLSDTDEGRVQLHRKFVERVGEPNEQSGGACTLKEGGHIIAYALPISGQGFWAPIKGVIGIKADHRTITGIAFYEQNETPGLGAQITKIAFTSQFQGKVVSSVGKPLNIKRPSDVLGKSDVHAVTGATQTSARLENIINDALKNWLSKFSQMNGGGQRQ
jgi:Na+-transporting NADH:ubiquinone oxidoreductase subunit C